MAESDKRSIRLTIPQRIIAVCGTAFVVGATIGTMRGGRAASLRFLAENAHRPPTTVQGWYFYKKTKNYKVMLGGLKGAAIEAGRLTALSLAYVGIEEGLEQTGWHRMKEVGAGVGTAVVFSAVCRSASCWGNDDADWDIDRLPAQMAARTIALGGIVGGVMTGLEWGREREKPAGAPEAV
ncbi:hypothetical protein CVT26_001686 [Gymnopilus dilepis]|uniref:Uncharacterized protein n=1 Tax=Gymnopilus dilepis TaxID=231916 RepID=A0A409VRF8_9AGAR|nr:hypothetical protein CVT26_001686 [Gymnopilus dilepis]